MGVRFNTVDREDSRVSWDTKRSNNTMFGPPKVRFIYYLKTLFPITRIIGWDHESGPDLYVDSELFIYNKMMPVIMKRSKTFIYHVYKFRPCPRVKLKSQFFCRIVRGL